MKIIQFKVCLMLLASLPPVIAAKAHDQNVHQLITLNAAASILESGAGLRPFVGLTSGAITEQESIDNLVQGSFDEDNMNQDEGGLRSYNHFYDPLTGLGLSEIPPDISLPYPLGHDSFTWATTFNCRGVDFNGILGQGVNLNTYNKWSWKNARSYEYLAFLAPHQSDRTIALTNMFRAIGQVVHLLQDSSQPQHTRNEQHLDKAILGKTPWKSPIEEYGNTNVNTLNYEHGVLDWRAAGFTKIEDFWNTHTYDGTATSLNAEAGGTAALGISEFVNGNFIGARHQYAEYYEPGDVKFYPLPSRDRSTSYNQVKADPASGLEDGGIYIRKTSDGVHVTHHSRINYLGLKIPGVVGKPYCTIDDPKVQEDYHDILIPKAVKYTAGLIDYFFRGQIDVAVAGTPITQDNIALQIKNISGTSEKLQNGTFRLFYDIDGTLTEIKDPDFTTQYSGSTGLDNNETTTAEFKPPEGDVSRYLLLYQGTIGSSDSSKADPVDQDIAIAVTSFQPPWKWNLTWALSYTYAPVTYDFNSASFSITAGVQSGVGRGGAGATGTQIFTSSTSVDCDLSWTGGANTAIEGYNQGIRIYDATTSTQIAFSSAGTGDVHFTIPASMSGHQIAVFVGFNNERSLGSSMTFQGALTTQ
jgi:hypothetical protein